MDCSLTCNVCEVPKFAKFKTRQFFLLFQVNHRRRSPICQLGGLGSAVCSTSQWRIQDFWKGVWRVAEGHEVVGEGRGVPSLGWGLGRGCAPSPNFFFWNLALVFRPPPSADTQFQGEPLQWRPWLTFKRIARFVSDSWVSCSFYHCCHMFSDTADYGL